MAQIPYTYLIGWSKQNKYYYGVRFAKGCHPSELWVKYKTSSKYVKHFSAEYGDPDIIQIRKTFSCIHKAREWETKVLTRLGVVAREDFLNKSNNKSIDPNTNVFYGDDVEKQASIRKKISNGLKGKRRDKANIESQKETIRGFVWWNNGSEEKKAKECPGPDWTRGRSWSPSKQHRETLAIKSKGNKRALGRKFTEEEKAVRSLAQKGIKKPEGFGAMISEKLKGRTPSPESIEKMKRTKKERGSNLGERNPMYGRKGDLSPLRHYHWYTDGQAEIFTLICPEGFTPGRIKRTQPSRLQAEAPAG